ncbi:MAG: Bug family tripartite tricarboxylate transporter substrate binding protein [Novosphingobium sp.]
MKRSTFLKVFLCAGFSGLLGAAHPADNQAFPNKAIKIVVPYAPGGGTDILARTLAERMRTSLGQPVIVENKSGAAGNLGVDAVAKAEPDGHTITLALSSNLMINQFLYTRLPYKPDKDLTLVAKIADAPLVLVVNASVPANNGTELRAYIRENRGKLSYGSFGAGTISHMSASRISEISGGDMTHAPYRGETPMIQDVVAGLIPMAFATGAQAPQFIAAGKLKAIGVTGTTPIPSLPNVPTLAEAGFDDPLLRAVGWVGIAVPAGTPKHIVQRLAEVIEQATRQADFQERIRTLGWLPSYQGPDNIAATYKREAPMWQQVIRRSGVTLD